MRALWRLVWCTLFRLSPRIGFSWWRRALLRLFGGKVGWPVYIHPSVRVWAPWNLELGSGVALAENVELYAVAAIKIGKYAVISQGAFVCTASHDIRSSCMDLVSSPIYIQEYAWIAARAYIGPGLTIGEGAVVGACAVVVKNVPDWQIVAGNPARAIGVRVISPS